MCTACYLTLVALFSATALAQTAANLPPLARGDQGGSSHVRAGQAAQPGDAPAAAEGSIVGWGLNVVGGDLSHGFLAVAAGGNHSLGLKANGTIVAWGANNRGQAIVPAPNTGFIAVAAGALHSLGLKADGSIVAWGSNVDDNGIYMGQLNVPSPNTGFVAVAASMYYSLGLKADGSIVAWGTNPYGLSPPPDTDFIAVAAGPYHSLGLKADGSIVGWGNNWYGQTYVPAPNSGFIAVAAGVFLSLGLKANGSIVVWGYNPSGENNVPVPNSGFIAVAAGTAPQGSHSLGVKADGSIVAWGYNGDGQTNVPAPNSGFIAVAAGRSHSLGLKADGAIVAWGGTRYDQLNVPAPNTGLVAVVPDLGLKADGSLVAWGSDNRYGQLNIPAPNTGFVAIAAGGGYSLGLKADGSIVAWGYNGYGQTNVPAPNSGFVGVAAGFRHSLGLKADGSIVAWGGDNRYGETNVPAPNSGFIAVAAADDHSLGLKADGSIVGWGANHDLQLNVPAPNSGFIAVATGRSHSLGLKADGSVVGWGASYYGQTNVPAPNSGFIAVAAGSDFSLGLKADRSVVGWGASYYGQTNVPAPNKGFIAIAAGYYSYSGLAIRGDLGPLIAEMAADVTSGIEPLTVTFADASAGEVTWWAWDFESDGTIDSTEQNPTHTFCARGSYTVTLTVGGPEGTDTGIRVGFITVDPVEPPASAMEDMILNAGGASVASVKSRFLSFASGGACVPQAVRVRFVSLPGAFSMFNGTFAWVDLPQAASELPGKSLSDPIGAEASFMAARLSSTPVFTDWSTLGVVHVFDERIVPSRKLPGQAIEPAIYEVQMVTEDSDVNSEASFSVPLSVTNARWGDVASLQAGEFRAPDGSIDVTADVLAVLAKFSNAPGAPIKARAEMVGTGAGGPQAAITGKIDISDVLAVLGAFSGGSYPFPPP